MFPNLQRCRLAPLSKLEVTTRHSPTFQPLTSTTLSYKIRKREQKERKKLMYPVIWNIAALNILRQNLCGTRLILRNSLWVLFVVLNCFNSKLALFMFINI